MVPDTGMWKVIARLPREEAEAAASVLEVALHPEALAVSWSEQETPPSCWMLEAYYATQPSQAELGRAFALAGKPAPEFELEELPATDWVAHSLAGLPAVRAGRFFIYGGHEAGRIPGGAIPLYIEAGQAFGTGHHPTTQGCLIALSDFAKRRRFLNPLDVGTGTGVLAMAMAKLWRRTGWACDSDPVAVRLAQENAHANGLASLVRLVRSNGLAARELIEASPFDLIVANILARPLIGMAATIKRRLNRNGTVILSGLLAEQAAAVLSAYRSQGLYLERRIMVENWATLVLK